MPRFSSAPRFVFKTSDGPGPGSYDPRLAQGYKAPTRSSYLTDGRSLAASCSSIMSLSCDLTGQALPFHRVGTRSRRPRQPRWSDDVQQQRGTADQAGVEDGTGETHHDVEEGGTQVAGSPSPTWSGDQAGPAPYLTGEHSKTQDDLISAIAERDICLARQDSVIANLQAQLRRLEDGGAPAAAPSSLLCAAECSGERDSLLQGSDLSAEEEAVRAWRLECDALQASLHVKEEWLRQLETHPLCPASAASTAEKPLEQPATSRANRKQSCSSTAATTASDVASSLAVEVDTAPSDDAAMVQEALVRCLSLEAELHAMNGKADALQVELQEERTAVAERDATIARQGRQMFALLAELQLSEVMVAAAQADLAAERRRTSALQDQLREASRSLEVQRASTDSWQDGLPLQAAAAERDAVHEKCVTLDALVVELQLELQGHVRRDVAAQEKCVRLQAHVEELQLELHGHAEARAELEGEVVALRRREASRAAAAAATAALDEAKVEEQRLRILVLQRKLRVLLPTCRSAVQTLETLEMTTAV